MRKFTLHKKERLKKTKDIEAVFLQGEKINIFPLRAFYSIGEKDIEPLLFGVGVGKKHFKRAVDRNRIKRLVREAYRTQKLSLKELALAKGVTLKLFFIFTGKELPAFNEIQEKISGILKKLEEELSKN